MNQKLHRIMGWAIGMCGVATLSALLALMASPAWATNEPGDPAGRVGRVAQTQGNVWMWDGERREWQPAQRNRPLTAGDRLTSETGAAARIHIGSTTLHLGSGSEIEMQRLDDARVVVVLHAGQLALRIRSREVAFETEVLTREGRFAPLSAGLYRVDRLENGSGAASWRGELRFEGGRTQFNLRAGQRADVWQQGRDLEFAFSVPYSDSFAQAVLRDDQRDERGDYARFVSPEMTGAEDLDRHGRWQNNPEYGALWLPANVAPGWAPYRFGQWAWVAPWGWTWVDDAPWGFAPFHYGRWVWLDARWYWAPGQRVHRPVYAPALVGWAGTPYSHINVRVGNAPAPGWAPLGPRDAYVPGHQHSPRYWERLNPGHDQRRRLPEPVHRGAVSHGEPATAQTVPAMPAVGAVAPSPAWQQRQHGGQAPQAPAAQPIPQPNLLPVPQQPTVPNPGAEHRRQGGEGWRSGAAPVTAPANQREPRRDAPPVRAPAVVVAAPVPQAPVAVPAAPVAAPAVQGPQRPPHAGGRPPVVVSAEVPVKPAPVAEAPKPVAREPREQRDDDGRRRPPESRQNQRERQQFQ